MYGRLLLCQSDFALVAASEALAVANMQPMLHPNAH